MKKIYLRFHVFNLTLNLDKISETYMKAIEEYPEYSVCTSSCSVNDVRCGRWRTHARGRRRDHCGRAIVTVITHTITLISAPPAHFRDNCDSDGLAYYNNSAHMCLTWISRFFYGLPPTTRPPDNKPSDQPDFAAIHLGKYLEGQNECNILQS